MPAIQIQPGPPSNNSATDGQLYTMLGGKSTEGIVAELHGKYYTQNYRQKLWHANITTATAIQPAIPSQPIAAQAMATTTTSQE